MTESRGVLVGFVAAALAGAGVGLVVGVVIV